MTTARDLLLRIPRQYRRPFMLTFVASISVICTFILWSQDKANRDNILGWGGLLFGVIMWRDLARTDYSVYDQRTYKHFTRDRTLVNLYEQQTDKYRDVEVASICLRVFRDVFPPDHGYGIPLILESITKTVSNDFSDIARNDLVGVDIGTGSGILAMQLAKHCGMVYATDIMESAVENARFNLQRLKDEGSDFQFQVSTGDLLTPVRNFLTNGKAVLIVFNHPYYPSPLNLFGTLIPEGGTMIINRFLPQVRELFEQVRGVLIMPYSPIAAEHNPLMIAPRHGLETRVYEGQTKGEDDVCILRLTKQSVE